LPHGDYDLECMHAGYTSVRYPHLRTLAEGDRVLYLRLRPSSDLEEWTVENYRVPDMPEPTEMADDPLDMPADGILYDTVIAFDPETYEERVALVRRSGSSEPRSAADIAAYETVAPSTVTTPAMTTARPMAAPPPLGKTEAPVARDMVSLGAKARADGKSKRTEPAMKVAKRTYDAPAEAELGTAPTPTPTPAKPATPQPRAGLLTAGEWNDLQNWGRHWLDLLADGEIATHQKTYGFNPQHRYPLLLTNEQDVPLADVTVMLQAAGETIWTARTDNTGRAELWKGLIAGASTAPEANLMAVAVVEGKVLNLGSPKEADQGLNRYRVPAACDAPRTVDIVWAVDATGSMGDEIEYLKTELLDVIGRAKALNGDLNFRMGTTFYRDEGDEYITKSSGLSYDISKTVDFIRQQHAGGGGDTPEAVHTALEEAIFRQKWSDRAIARICFLVLDASPHQTPEVNASLHRSILEAARRGIRVVAVTASGIQKDTEFLMKFFGLATNGTYVFLTDHSGIGGKHLEPTTDEYKVENLNNLLVRLISEYTATETCEGKSSIRFEPDPQQQQPGPAAQAIYYPNPASTQFLLELPFEVESVTLYNADGKAVRKMENPKGGTHTVAVNDLPDGLYTLR
ncbi:MAG TPA: VWA domain-containing protein, partial [Saprospiraceae bacterium]|nr:VWA domain-containing protein [Saprospiraceae bacterium]